MVAIVDVIIGGLVGTIIMTVFMEMGKKMSMMPTDWDMMKDGMGKKMEEMGLPGNMALLVHWMIGVIIHPVVFTFIWYEFVFDGNLYLSGIIYAIIFGVMMFLMLGFLGAPSEWKMKMGMGMIMGHIFYGLSLGLFADLAIVG